MTQLTQPKKQGGFALLITITLLAFLVLLLVSLASLTRVETQVAANTQQLSQARQNAALALSLALGRLQVLAGPDQRATTTADVNVALGGQDGTHAWTGVWGNANTSGDYTSSAKLLGWLVSGNEQGTFTADTTAAAFGKVSAPSTPAFSPADAVTLGTASTNGGLATDVKLKSQDARVLIGPGSVSATKDYVFAPLQNIQVPASTIPGLTGNTPNTIGRYAWWVGDEGVKARLNLVDPWTTAASNAQERFDRLMVAQRHGIELVTTDGTTPFGTSLYNVEGSGATATQFRTDLAKALSYPQVYLLTGFGTNTITTALQLRRHDLTTVSRGVLADQLRGGLRHDLTPLLDADPSSWTGALKTSLDSASYTYAGARRVADFQSSQLYSNNSYSMNTAVGAADARSPVAATWEQVQGFYHYAATNTGVVNVAAQTNSQMAIAPIVLRWGVAFDLSATSTGNGQLNIFPHVVLWNPYNVTLRGGYRVRVEFSDNDTSARYLYFVTDLDSAGQTITSNYPVYYQEYIASLNAAIPGKYSNRTMEFTIPSVDIPAGQTYIFTPQATQAYQASGDNPLANTYGTTNSFTRSIGHPFTPAEIQSTALVFAKGPSPSAGGTVSLHLLDASGNRLQLIDSVGLTATYTVDNSAGAATKITSTPQIGWCRNISTEPTTPLTQVGFCLVNSLQQTDPRCNWLAHCNQRAPSIGRAWFEWNTGFANNANWGTANKLQVSKWTTLDMVSTSPARAYTGPSLAASTGATEAILFNLPRADTPVLSLGQLQHVELTLMSSGNEFKSSGHEPTYPFGNAYATPQIAQNRLLNPNTNTAKSTFAGSEAHLTDVSYLINRALWDRFFFSGTPDVSTAALQTKINAGDPLPDGRIRYLGQPLAADVRDFDKAAAHLMVDGAFNINSTSVEAWTALFASLRNVPVNPATGTSGTISGTPYVRTPYVTGGATTSSRTDQWAGYRTLTDAQVRTLAASMVTEVQTRGPFLSLADFVNRRLVAYPDATGLAGALQAALDLAPAVNTAVLDLNQATADSTKDVPATTAEIWTYGSHDYYLQNIIAPRRNATSTIRSKGAMAPGFLSQADMLEALGPGLAARSDTFVIRAYGETVNPLLPSTDPSYITGRAWCEAVVQRLPDYMDSTPTGNAAEVQPVTGNTVNLTVTNQRFGRRFQVVSFRWLTPKDI